jgi:hypothetical protein
MYYGPNPTWGRGFADGGSFIVPGGYSANDNMMARFPVASGEEVIVNRTPGAGSGGGTVVHQDNRIIIQGNVGPREVDQIKMSQYQQRQQMARMARA